MNSLSVIIPVYNAEQYLDECISSIFKELKPEDEIILINDGSTDSSLDICRKYEADNICVINNSNHGVSYSRNCGLSKAKCDYITFVDSDDYLLSGWRDTLERGIETGKDIVYFSKISDTVPCKEDVVASTLCIPMENPLSIKASACWDKLFRLEFIKKNNIEFDCDIINGEDGLFCLDAVLCDGSFTVIKSDEFYFYRINNASATHSFNEKYNTSNLKFIKTVNEKLTASGLFSPETVKTYVNYLDSHGLYILAGRIARIEDLSERRKKYALFTQPEYIELFKNYTPDKYCSKRTKTIFTLLKAQKYDKAMRNIIFYRKLYNVITKVMKRKNGI